MFVRVNSYRVCFTSEEECALRAAIKEYITKNGWNTFFDDVRTDGTAYRFLRIYRATDFNPEIDLNVGEIYFIVEMLKAAYAKHPVESVKNMIDGLSEYII